MSSRRFAFLLGCAFVVAPTAATAQTRPLPTRPIEDDGKPHVDAYAAVEYATVARQFESLSMRGLSRQPYVLKVADVHLINFGPFEAGLNAAATSLVALGGFTDGEAPAKVQLEEAERYAGLLGYAINKKVTLLGEAHYARMTTFAAPQFERNTSFPLTTYYFPSSGPAQRLHPGSTVGGNTEWYTLAVSARINGDMIGFDDTEIGYRYFRLSTLSAYAISPTSYTADAIFLGLVRDDFTCHSASFNTKVDKIVLDDFHLSGGIHGGVGYSSVSSNLVDSSGGVCFNYGGTMSLELREPKWAVALGYSYDEIASLAFSDEHPLKQTISYADPSTKRVTTAASGSSWNAIGPAQSIRALGPFARLTVFF